MRPNEDEANAVRVKGLNFMTCLDAVQKLYGPAARVRLERETPGDLGDALRFGGIVAGGWYRVRWYRDFWQSMRDQLHIDELATRRLGHKSTSIGVSVAHRMLTKIASPEMLMSQAPKVFRCYFDRGQIVAKQAEPSRFVIEWSKCIGFDGYIWNSIAGGTLYFLEAAGAKSPEFTVLGGGDNFPWMLAAVTFR